MLLLQKLENVDNLSTSERAIAKFLLEQKEQIKDLTTKDIANTTFTSPAAVVRLAQKLEFAGWNELKKELLKEIDYIHHHFTNIDANLPFEQKDDIMTIASKIHTLMIETANDSHALLDHDNLQKAVQIMRKSSTINIYGVSFPLIFAEDFKHKLMRIGKRVDIVDIVGEQLYATSLIEPSHCALMISYSGETRIVKSAVKILKKKNIPIIAITSMGDNTLRRNADCVLTITSREKLYSKIAAFSTEYSIHYLLDVLYSCYFALNYDENLNKKIELSRILEYDRYSTSDILKEE